MAGQNQVDLFDAYFRRADLDRNGEISGAEAVAFFQGANLSKQVLFQIWNYADQNRAGSLGRAQFYNALKLVTVAQSKRELTPDIVKSALSGPASAKIPAPQINLAALSMPQSSVTRATPPASQLTNVRPIATQNSGFRPVLPNTTMNQQYAPPPGSGLVRPPSSVSGVASRPVQGVGFPGISVGSPSLGSNQPNSGFSSDAGVANVATTPTAMFSGRGNSPLPNHAGLPSGSPTPVASTPSKPPVASASPVPSSLAAHHRPPVAQNGFGSGSHLGGNTFSSDELQPKLYFHVSS